jgi:5'-methylthioadenosine phosphorylase
MIDMKPDLGIIGGSGLYEMDGLTNIEQIDYDTPFGKPSSPLMLGTINGKRVAFLARHGIGHFLMPSEVNYRANIFALKAIGVSKVVSISAVGSLKEEYAPGHIIIPDNLFDFTKANRAMTFFGEGVVGHISVAEPFCPNLSETTFDAVKKTGATTHFGGTLITIEGPRFSTKAESNIFRSWGISLIGMTACPEAFLAREAELCYTTMAHVTDYDVWHESEQAVTVDMVIETLRKNIHHAQDAIRNIVDTLDQQHTCEGAAAGAIMTSPSVMNQQTKRKLETLYKKYF